MKMRPVRGFDWPSKIRAARESRGWSQHGVARTISVDRRQIIRWETEGRIPRPEARELLYGLYPELKDMFLDYLMN